MKKIIIILLSCFISAAYPCDRLSDVEKAYHILNNAWRHIEQDPNAIMNGRLYVEADHALKVYFGEFYKLCTECQVVGIARFSGVVAKLESFIESCAR